ncbi:MAG TPA: aspartate carbamoyltransferase catalytic subunit [Myxococcota bacterium]|jgi:aspartate carbamoyltransferase catalytic subunit|nr:aspartate carbamoyltransferase catalytic subunit [Myxococcota bacterium]
MTGEALFPHRHLLGIEPLGREDLVTILDLADQMAKISERAIKRVPTLRGKTVINMFMEASTRTRTSFEIAGKRLSADVINFSSSGSSTEKGETLLDTAKNLMAMHPDVIVMRSNASGAASFIARNVGAAVVNAGDGMHEHPTQALLDAATIRKHKGRIEGLTVAILGDIAHSRVARSNVLALGKLGARVRLAGPRTLLPLGLEGLGPGPVEVFDRVEPAIEGADVVMVLRLQKERMSAGLIPNTREYSRYFGLNAARLALAKPDAIVMHPGPINRGVELDPGLADGARSVILDQVSMGVAVRMAVLYLLAGPSPSEDHPS